MYSNLSGFYDIFQRVRVSGWTLTKKTLIDVLAFKERLRSIRQQGFVVEEGEAYDLIGGVAAPVRDFTGKVVAAIGVGFVSPSVDDQTIREIAAQTVDTAAQISQELGYLITSERPQ